MECSHNLHTSPGKGISQR